MLRPHTVEETTLQDLNQTSVLHSAMMQDGTDPLKSSLATLPQTNTAIGLFVHDSTSLLCPICQQDLQQPIQLKTCYHIFCQGCIQQHTENCEDGEVACPACVCDTVRPVVKDNDHMTMRALHSDTDLHMFHSRQPVGGVCEVGDVSKNSGDVSCGEADRHESCFCLQNSCDGCQKNINDKDNAGIGDSVGEVPHDGETGTEKLYACPICREMDTCEHEKMLQCLTDEEMRKDDKCHISKHAAKSNGTLIAYCTECEDAICGNCSLFEHRDHRVCTLTELVRVERHQLLESFIQILACKLQKFESEAKLVDNHNDEFSFKLEEKKEKIIAAKDKWQTWVEGVFSEHLSLVEQKGHQIATDRKARSARMHQEKEFLNKVTMLGATALEETATDVEVVRVTKAVAGILADMEGRTTVTQSKVLTSRGDSHGAQDTDLTPETADRETTTRKTEVHPLDSDAKQLVLPSPLHFLDPHVLPELKTVGTECAVLHKSDILKVKDELLMSHSILPLNEREALVSCTGEPFTASVMLYNTNKGNNNQVRSISLTDEGQYHLAKEPGYGLVATLYQDNKHSRKPGKRQVLLWNQVLGGDMARLNENAMMVPKVLLKDTGLPPSGVAVTHDNNLVICTSGDPWETPAAADVSRLLIVTMTGTVLHQTDLPTSSIQHAEQKCCRARHITCNINGDICVTSERDRSVFVFDSRLALKCQLCNPYTDDNLNQKFCPRGICHDSYGRLIVADADNNAVIRLTMQDNDQLRLELEPQIILQEGVNGIRDFNCPTLVAVGPGPKLWVVCRNNIHLFDYMDRE